MLLRSSALPAAATAAGARRMMRRSGAGVKRRIRATSSWNARWSMPSVVELLVEEVRRDAVEEQVDGEHDHDDVVEARR